MFLHKKLRLSSYVNDCFQTIWIIRNDKNYCTTGSACQVRQSFGKNDTIGACQTTDLETTNLKPFNLSLIVLYNPQWLQKLTRQRCLRQLEINIVVNFIIVPWWKLHRLQFMSCDPYMHLLSHKSASALNFCLPRRKTSILKMIITNEPV